MTAQAVSNKFASVKPVSELPWQSYESELTAPMVVTNKAKGVAVEFKNLQDIGRLGQGAAGYVELVQCRTSGKAFAMKVISKKSVVESGQIAHIQNERAVQMALDHNSIIKLYGTVMRAR